MKFTFTSEFQGFGSPKNILEFEADDISDVVMYFEQFLRGAGYHFDGHLDLCNITQPALDNVWERWNEPEQELAIHADDNQDNTNNEELTFPDVRCKVCNLTAEQLGDHKCYDTNCGLK
jgi:hypothetical protein